MRYSHYVPSDRTCLIASFALLAAGCGLGLTGSGIDYTMEPQEFAANLGDATGTFPEVSCAENVDVCSTTVTAAGLPSGPNMTTTARCDAERGQCVAAVDLHYYQVVNLSQESIPPAIASSSVISHVEVDAIRYWVAMNSVNTTTPPISLYVGPQTAQKVGDPGVVLLGTLPSLSAGQKTACGSGGAPGTQESACDLPLTEDGKRALGMFARDIRTPFNIIVSATLTVHADDPVPAGAVNFFVQPVLSFVL